MTEKIKFICPIEAPGIDAPNIVKQIFCELPAGQARGDLNADGTINFKDLTILAETITNNTSISDDKAALYDVKQDGTIDKKDITELSKHIRAKSDESLPDVLFNKWKYYQDYGDKWYYDLQLPNDFEPELFDMTIIITENNQLSSDSHAVLTTDSYIRIFTSHLPTKTTQCVILCSKAAYSNNKIILVNNGADVVKPTYMASFTANTTTTELQIDNYDSYTTFNILYGERYSELGGATTSFKDRYHTQVVDMNIVNYLLKNDTDVLELDQIKIFFKDKCLNFGIITPYKGELTGTGFYLINVFGYQ